MHADDRGVDHLHGRVMRRGRKSAFGAKQTSKGRRDGLDRSIMTRLRHRGDVVDLIGEADKYPSSRHVRYDFSAMALAGSIVVQQTIARDECVRFTRACRHASAA
jgi:hypothetical protein